jgi:glutamate racemase
MIGVFDSGLGGLTVLKQLKKNLPEYDYLYLGDTLHVPYGSRSDEAVFDLTKKACEYLFAQGCTLIILACNTASSRALRRLQQEYLPEIRAKEPHKNILGVIHPVVETIAEEFDGPVGVIGTNGTINSEAYVVELKKQKSGFEVFQKATPLLVPLIEEGWVDQPETATILQKYLESLLARDIKTLILGCTHYPLLIDQIREIVGNGCSVPNPAEIVAESLKDYLARHPEIEETLKKNKQIKYCVTDLNENFEQLSQQFLQEKIKIKKVNI